MSIPPIFYRARVIEPVCEMLADTAGIPDTSFARDLVLATAAAETFLGTILPPGGLTHMPEEEYYAIMSDYIKPSPRFSTIFHRFSATSSPPYDQLDWNLALGVIVTRLQYHRTHADKPSEEGNTYLDQLYLSYDQAWFTELPHSTFIQRVAQLSDISKGA